METRFEPGDWLKAIGGILFLAASLLPWWRIDYPNGFDLTTDARDYTLTGIVPCIIFVAIALLTIIIQTQQLSLPEWLLQPVGVLAASILASLLVAVRFFWDGYSDTAAGEGDVSRGLGLYLAAAAAVIVLIGGVIGLRAYLTEPVDDGDDDDDEDDLDIAPIRRPAEPPLP